MSCATWALAATALPGIGYLIAFGVFTWASFAAFRVRREVTELLLKEAENHAKSAEHLAEVERWCAETMAKGAVALHVIALTVDGQGVQRRPDA